jgi:hypothetical protein
MVAMILSLSLSGCATHGQTGTLVGGAAGAAVGAGLGGAIGGKTGALVGGALGTMVGSATGAGIGDHFDNKQERDREEVIRSDGYASTRDPVLGLVGIEAIPAVVSPGDEVRVRVTYDILAPDPQQQIPVTETWIFTHNNQELTRVARPEELKDQGEHSSTFRFSMADEAIPGPYEAIVTISNGQEQKTAMTQFRVQE